MELQNLTGASLRGRAEILPAPPERTRVPAQKRQFTAGGTLTRFAVRGELTLEYASGMPVLILYGGKEPELFYLDRVVRLPEGTRFSIAPLVDGCEVLFFAAEEPAAEDTVDAAFLAEGGGGLAFGAVHSFFYQESAQSFYFRGERHEPFELVYVDRGELYNVVNGRSCRVGQQCAMLVGPNDWHMQYSEAPVSFLTVSFSASAGCLRPICNRPMQLPPRVRALIGEMLREHEQPDAFARDMLCALMQLVLVALLRAGEEDRSARARTLPATAAAGSRIVDDAVQYIAGHIRSEIRLQELAAAVHVSVPHLCSLFRTQLGMPPGRYITKIRLDECKARMREGREAIGQIAAEFGFSSVQQFSRRFRSALGITPSEYVRSLRE